MKIHVAGVQPIYLMFSAQIVTRGSLLAREFKHAFLPGDFHLFHTLSLLCVQTLITFIKVSTLIFLFDSHVPASISEIWCCDSI
ncbi:hypothetical protein HanPI659440_Chr00c01g0706711 [Helianthus annuus]|nr:hypothetical protein HanPI659440_Chr00c01g0706711 [Helianthus annuus]